MYDQSNFSQKTKLIFYILCIFLCPNFFPGEGIHTVMETVESTLKVPAPEKLAEGWEEELDDNEEEITG